MSNEKTGKSESGFYDAVLRSKKETDAAIVLLAQEKYDEYYAAIGVKFLQKGGD